MANSRARQKWIVFFVVTVLSFLVLFALGKRAAAQSALASACTGLVSTFFGRVAAVLVPAPKPEEKSESPIKPQSPGGNSVGATLEEWIEYADQLENEKTSIQATLQKLDIRQIQLRVMLLSIVVFATASGISGKLAPSLSAVNFWAHVEFLAGGSAAAALVVGGFTSAVRDETKAGDAFNIAFVSSVLTSAACRWSLCPISARRFRGRPFSRRDLFARSPLLCFLRESRCYQWWRRWRASSVSPSYAGAFLRNVAMSLREAGGAVNPGD
jgi:hypothetical protein